MVGHQLSSCTPEVEPAVIDLSGRVERRRLWNYHVVKALTYYSYSQIGAKYVLKFYIPA